MGVPFPSLARNECDVPARPRRGARHFSGPRLSVRVPRDFSLDAVVASHGWYQLAPFRFDPRSRTLAGCIRLPAGAAAAVRMLSAPGGVVAVAVDRRLRSSDAAFVKERVARMLHLDAAVGPFHRLCRADPALAWIAKRKLGRLLRGQDLWEDALKTLLTTNCTWKQTVSMVGRLVELIGPTSASGARAVPGPEAVIDAGVRFFERDVRVGYRARAAVDLAKRAREGELESLPSGGRELRAAIEGWRGFGPYAATALLALLGVRDRPVIDSWALARASELHFRGRRCKAKDVERVYARFGDWSGLVAWFDLNREHYREWPPSFGVSPQASAT